MADEKRDLPEVPQKLTLWQRLSSKAYDEAMASVAEYRANLEAVMRDVEATEAGFVAREDSVKAREDAVRRNEWEANRRIDEKNTELILREDAIAKKEEELRKREEAVKAREDAIGTRESAADAKKRDGERAEAIFREKEGISPEVSTRSLERDEFIKQSLQAIKVTAEKLRQLTVMNKGRKMTPVEITSLNSQKANLRAALLATVCAYRDTLPEMDRLAFSINGKSCSVFLQEQTQLIAQETDGMHLEHNGLTISREALEIVDSTYKSVAKGMGLDAGAAYSGAAYPAFHGNLGLTDSRNAEAAIFERCADGEAFGLNLYGAYSKTARSTTDITQTTSVETEINTVAKSTDEWEK